MFPQGWGGGQKYNGVPTIQPRVAPPQISPANVLSNADLYDVISVLAMGQAVTVLLPAGIPYNGQALFFKFQDNGTARAITWASGFYASTVSLPTTTVISAMLTVFVQYDADNTTPGWYVKGVS